MRKRVEEVVERMRRGGKGKEKVEKESEERKGHTLDAVH